jgi:hypothetical protein
MTQSFQASHVIASQALGFETIEEVAAEISVGGALFQQMVENDEHRMAHRCQAFQSGIVQHEIEICRCFMNKPG